MKKLFNRLNFILQAMLILIFNHPDRYGLEFDKLREKFTERNNKQ